MDFEGIRSGESLSCFIDRVVNPNTNYLKQCGKTIDEVAEALRSSQFQYSVMRTIKGGSIGKGTAVRGLSDVDLIFPIYDITTVETLKQKMDGIKNAIDSLLRSRFTVKDSKITTWAYNTNILIDGSWQEVDIMPILNITNDPSNLTDEEIKTIHTKMRKEAGSTERGYYNRCLRPLQTEFIGKHPEKIKRVIRLIKYWIKTNNHTIIKSIAVELLVIGAWEDLGKPHPGVAEEDIAKLVFDKLRNFGDIKLSWTNYYKPTDYSIPSTPYILDPVDPYNNVISQITRHYCRGLHVPSADREVMQQVYQLQRDAERAFRGFK
ncbi:2'-5'-oligoadenylate synthase 1A-like [Mytilus californianus]|uniref:2'-5'-oligoadenylate synthase 1A-like n=1 Tax=Mytilus californianus TaxID=6549 RepID=UPI002247E87A|nr:2'-5'-oligoadenylate synthase 1A-like [Mytilus californianus]XP_052085279.1 2'-5'-oligoadenylate synthase 1A-like [Mytilus californianus]XP_052085280.1 2'-5'-oligoadenylate synthase 1A-like [Mytilus californianus]XP_052085281.1 2'-5'-oligoadenylate synthase 1A-like [Mytilus californianus]